MLAFAALPATDTLAADSVVVRTNWVEQSITNVVELRMPKNVFVTEFHTNWFDQFTTNFVTIYQTNHVNVQTTNWVNKYVTNNLAVSRVRTNSVDNYRTNWIGKTMTNDFLVNHYRTNVVDSYYTNFVTKNLTNVHVINLVHTNVFDAYVTNSTTRELTNEIAINLTRTNFHTVNVTNWQTVLATHTNYVNHLATNVVQVDAPASQKPGPAAAVTTTTTATVATSAPAAPVGSAGLAASASGEEPVIEATRDPRPLSNNQYEITLRLKWASPAPNQIQHWWIERDDGAYLSVGQDRVFRRELPPGNYRVEAKVQHDPDSSVLTLRRTLMVTTREVVVREKSSAKKLAAN